MSGDGTSFEARIVLRPRTLDETMDLVLAYIRLYHRDLRWVAVVAVLAATLPTLAVWILSGQDARYGAWALVFFTGIAERVVTVFAGRHLFNNPISVWGAWRQVLRRLPFNLIVLFGVYLPILMMVSGVEDDDAWLGFGIVLGVFWPLLLASHAHLSEVAHLEHLSPGRAAQRARALVSYRFGRALGLLLTSALVRFLFAIGTYSAGAFVVAAVLQLQGAATLIAVPLAILGLAASGPFMTLVRFFDYIDARTRREGWDIQVRFNAIAQRERQERARSLAA
ncbi:MAG: hypothetical protein H6730_37685 [Deltaproteobacteria bacterium]|nr:hypothetical protein [Deltaproteobacteria bacterium]